MARRGQTEHPTKKILKVEGDTGAEGAKELDLLLADGHEEQCVVLG